MTSAAATSLTAVWFLAAGCTMAQSPPVTDATGAPPPELAQDPPKSAKDVQPLPTFSQGQLEALARADLARRLGVPADSVSLVGTRPVEWPDASMGCAAGDEATSGGGSKGFVITLAHAGRRYTYHTDLRQAIPCPPIKSQ